MSGIYPFALFCVSGLLWLASNVSPILLTHILVNLDGRAATIQRIATVTLWARNPVVVARVHIVVVGLETQPLETLKTPATIVNRPARLGKCDSPDACWPCQTTTLLLDIHDATFHTKGVCSLTNQISDRSKSN